MFCAECGQQIPPESKFCLRCGRSLGRTHIPLGVRAEPTNPGVTTSATEETASGVRHDSHAASASSSASPTPDAIPGNGTCPNCGSVNPPGTEPCECGYDLVLRRVKVPPSPAERSASPTSFKEPIATRRALSITVGAFTGLMALNMISDFFHSDAGSTYTTDRLSAVLEASTPAHVISNSTADLQCIWVLCIGAGILLAKVWIRFDKGRLPRPKVARFFGGLLYCWSVMMALYMVPFELIKEIDWSRHDASHQVKSSATLGILAFALLLLGGSYLLSYGKKNQHVAR